MLPICTVFAVVFFVILKFPVLSAKALCLSSNHYSHFLEWCLFALFLLSSSLSASSFLFCLPRGPSVSHLTIIAISWSVAYLHCFCCRPLCLPQVSYSVCHWSLCLSSNYYSHFLEWCLFALFLLSSSLSSSSFLFCLPRGPSVTYLTIIAIY